MGIVLQACMLPRVLLFVDQVLLELCGGDVADAARSGGPDSLPQEQRDFMQRQSMVVSTLGDVTCGLASQSTGDGYTSSWGSTVVSEHNALGRTAGCCHVWTCGESSAECMQHCLHLVTAAVSGG